MIFLYIQHATKYYNKHVLKAITQNLVIYPASNPVRTCVKYSIHNNTGMLQWCCDHTGTHVAILVNMSANLVPKTGNVVDFTLFYVFLLAINTTFLCIYQEKCCFVSIFSVPCTMMEWFIQLQLNVLCHRVLKLNSCKYRVWDA